MISRFLIPRREKESPEKVCFASIIQTYFEGLNKELPNRRDDILFFNGQKVNKAGKSKFLDKPLGVNTIGDTGKHIAKFLGLKDPERYTGHCFRRTAATLAAEKQASVFEMQNHFGWKNPKTALEYISKSKPQQDRMAAMISGYSGSKNANIVNPVPGTSSASKEKEDNDLDQEEVPDPEAEKSDENEDEENCSKEQEIVPSQPAKRPRTVLSQVANSTTTNSILNNKADDEGKGTNNNFNFSNCQVSIVYHYNQK